MKNRPKEHSTALYTKPLSMPFGGSLSRASSTVLDQEALKELQGLELKGLKAETAAVWLQHAAGFHYVGISCGKRLARVQAKQLQ